MKNKKTKVVISIVIVFIVVCAVVIYYFLPKETEGVKLTKEYNKAVCEYNELLDKYNETTKISSIDNLEGCKIPAGKLKKESEKSFDVEKSLNDSNSLEIIKKDTETIKGWIDMLENSISIAEKLNNPKIDWVKDRITTGGKINSIETVSDSNQIEKYLGQDNNCSGIIYFGLEYIDADSVEGDSITEKGTDVGGSIEIYNSLETAEKRCEYLQQFDNTYLYSGSYAILGTMVVRTSYRLENEQQLEITDWIFEQLSKVE